MVERKSINWFDC